MLLCNGAYKYEYVDCFTGFDETSLGAYELFATKLTEFIVTDTDYIHAYNMWTAFDMHTFSEYHDLYLLTDVLLLANVFKSFRYMVIGKYDLGPCHFYSLPGFTWNAMLKLSVPNYN